ncbi:hypothetical protein HanRHA438_Chr01g0009681 [Helianthus annuus]|nr:hypothetical protein HanRHA438_Chr01g0009681 [Helianthus annuus]
MLNAIQGMSVANVPITLFSLYRLGCTVWNRRPAGRGSSPASNHPAPSRHRRGRRVTDGQDGPSWWAPLRF